MSGVGRQPARKISNPPIPHSNRTSSSYASSNHSNQRRSGRGTPSSESDSSKKNQMRSKSVVDLSPPPPPLPAQLKIQNQIPKKKGFSLFSIFKRNKKKGDAFDQEAAAAAAAALAEIKAEEMRLLHEEEFTKLRRQREKDRSRSLYDMLPSQSRLTVSEPTSRNLSSPSTHSSLSPTPRMSHYSPPRYPDQSPAPRMRSASSSNVQNPRPTSHYPSPLYAASRSSTHFHSPELQRDPHRDYHRDSHRDAHRSTESVVSPNHRTMAKSPLIPAYYDPRQSFYAMPTQSHSHLMHYPNHPPVNHRSSRAYN